jgi:hypothetical protein
VNSSDGRIEVKESGSTDQIAAQATYQDRARIEGSLVQHRTLFLAVSRVVTESGVWQVDRSLLETAVRGRIDGHPHVSIEATFEPNVVLAPHDRSELFKLIMNDFLSDSQKIARLQGQSDLFVLRESVDFPLPEVAGKTLFALSQHEIQKIADHEKRVIFLKYEPFRVEGSQVSARIAIRDAVTRERRVFTQYKYAFLFTCVKENNRWTIKKSVGYAQG